MTEIVLLAAANARLDGSNVALECIYAVAFVLSLLGAVFARRG